jgi:hypothetical protein
MIPPILDAVWILLASFLIWFLIGWLMDPATWPLRLWDREDDPRSNEGGRDV